MPSGTASQIIQKRFMQLGKAIKMCRERKGLSRTELADKAGISLSYLSLLEKNGRDPSVSKVKDISDALDVPTSILMFLASDKDEIESISPELAEKLSLLSLKLMESH